MSYHFFVPGTSFRTKDIMILVRKLIFLLCISGSLFLSVHGNAQRICLTPSIGISNYSGDLSVGYTSIFKPAFSLGASWDASLRYRLRANISRMSVEGDDRKSPAPGVGIRGLNFKTNITELGLLGEYDLVSEVWSNVIPYIFSGIGVYHFNPKPLRLVNGQDVNLHDLGTEGQLMSSGQYAKNKYNLTQLNLQFGGGVRFNMSNDVSIAVEANYRKLFTDYLDDVSSARFVSKEEWDAEIAKNPNAALAKSYAWLYDDDISKASNPYTKRGNPSQKDSYQTLQLKLCIRIKSKMFGEDIYDIANPRGRGHLENYKNRW